jgi:hypothetical protein
MPADTAAVLLTAVLAAGSAAPTAAEPPDAELLEFLGKFETVDGKWLDPLVLDDESDKAPAAKREEKQP